MMVQCGHAAASPLALPYPGGKHPTLLQSGPWSVLGKSSVARRQAWAHDPVAGRTLSSLHPPSQCLWPVAGPSQSSGRCLLGGLSFLPATAVRAVICPMGNQAPTGAMALQNAKPSAAQPGGRGCCGGGRAGACGEGQDSGVCSSHCCAQATPLVGFQDSTFWGMQPNAFAAAPAIRSPAGPLIRRAWPAFSSALPQVREQSLAGREREGWGWRHTLMVGGNGSDQPRD